MSNARKVKDLMVKITEYPHIPYWLSVRDAISMIHSAYGETPALGEPRMVLVFDEKYQLQGLLTLKNLLTGIEPGFLRKDEKSPYQGLTHEDYARLSTLVEGTFSEKCKEEARKPVSEVMTPIRARVDVNDSVAKAAFVMLQADVNLVPVMDGEKIAGVLRMSDVFNELTKIVLE
ncbi:MAG: CBS domain-containing protein [Deltaproteobacteria bacterium]|nr:CBS domain-containing protein [Deltaproteobacteria bacterium]MBW1793568.1 CBS domain-containing protein [Deltaproteobacteria bacterium]